MLQKWRGGAREGPAATESRLGCWGVPPPPPSMSDTALTPFAPPVPISVPLRAFSALRAATWVQLVNDNPLTWSWRQGRRNERADMEGACAPPPGRLC